MPSTTALRREYLNKQNAAEGGRRYDALVAASFIPPERWGRDHLTALLYLETRCVDHSGYIRLEHMRGKDPKYPTRLANGEIEEMHSDFDCILDMIAFGYVEYAEPGANAPLSSGGERYRLTSAGWAKAHELRKERAARGLKN